MKWPIWMTALMALSAVGARSARADPDAPGAPGATQPPSGGSAPTDKAVDVVITGTRTAEDSRRAPVRTDVVTRAEAERRGATNVGEALSGQLGVQVNPSAYGYLGNPSGIQIQGFDAERVLVLEDGERVLGDTGGVVDLATIPITDVSRIELVTGPSSSLYGSNAIGGVVNVLSAPPELEGWSGRASVEGRYFWGLTLRGAGAYRRADKWASVDASLQRKVGFAISEDKPDLAVPNLTRSLLGLRAGTRLGDRITLALRARWVHDDLLGLRSQIVPGVQVIDLPEQTDRFALHLIESIDLPRGATLRISAGRQWFMNSATEDTRRSPKVDVRDRSDGMHSAEAVATIPEGPSRTYVIGARAEFERFEQQLTSTKPVNATDVVTTHIAEVPNTSLGNAALFGQLRWAFGDTLTLLPGLRAETHLHYGSVVTPRLAASFAPLPKLLFRVSGGRGFRTPGAKEFGFNFDHSLFGYRVLGSPDLKPETSWGVNGDVSLTPQRGLTLRAGGFVNWVEQLIDFQFADKQDPRSTVTNYEYTNVGRARTFGVQFDAAFRVQPWFRVEAGYAYLWTRDDTNEQPLQGRPPHTVTSAITATLPGSVEMYLRFRAVTDAYSGQTGANGTLLRTLGFQTLDARLARGLWPKATAYVGVQNIFGAQKALNQCGDEIHPNQWCVDQRPLEGRTIYIGLTAEGPWRD